MPMPGSAGVAMVPSAEAIRAAILDLARGRGEGRSFCPSEPARVLDPDWRALMPQVRAQAALLQDWGLIVVTQRGQPVRADTARGPIRLRLKPVGAGR